MLFITNNLMGLLSLFKRRTDSYYGNEAHKYVDKLLSGGKNLLIVSPYIDDYYADYLASHARGKRMYIISSSIKKSAAKRLRGADFSGVTAAAFLLTSFNAALFVSGFFSASFALLSVSSVAAYAIYSLTHRNRISLKIPSEFVHAKMYVSDSAAIEGSANLTYAGMHKNIEGIRIISNPEQLDELKRRFWTLWNSL
jgi:phosphatidylserine/phosphatidylglycerophosphate/cardiolipin synthase-like enzyme